MTDLQIIKNLKKEGFTDNEITELLNILQAHGENLNTFYSFPTSGNECLCQVYFSADTHKETFEGLKEYNIFLTEKEFINRTLEKIADLKKDPFFSDSEVTEEIIRDAEYIEKTQSGYVEKLYY